MVCNAYPEMVYHLVFGDGLIFFCSPHHCVAGTHLDRMEDVYLKILYTSIVCNARAIPKTSSALIMITAAITIRGRIRPKALSSLRSKFSNYSEVEICFEFWALKQASQKRFVYGLKTILFRWKPLFWLRKCLFQFCGAFVPHAQHKFGLRKTSLLMGCKCFFCSFKTKVLPRKRAFVFCGKTSCCLHSYRTKPVSMDLMVKSMGIHVFFPPKESCSCRCCLKPMFRRTV